MTELKLRKKIKRKWLKALRSGEYQQGMRRLASVNGQTTYCCLGVLCDLAVKAGVVSWKSEDGELFMQESPNKRQAHVLPTLVIDWAFKGGASSIFDRLYEQQNAVLPIRDNGQPTQTLSGLNDHGKSFAYIADAIEEHM